MLDIPWRVKLLLPTVASLPLLIAYSGATAIGIPKPVQASHHLCMGALSMVHGAPMLVCSVHRSVWSWVHCVALSGDRPLKSI